MTSKGTVALIGNMNNMLFQQQRYYDDWGYDTTLFLFEEHAHFLPNADVFFDPYKKYKIVNLGWNIESFESIKKKYIYNLFSGFDILIGTDLAPAYLYKAGLKLDIFCLHGNDVYEFPFFRFKKNVPSLWEINRCYFSICQFEGLKLANYLALNKAAELYEKPIAIIRKKDKRMASIPYLYLPQFTKEYFEQSELIPQIKKLKDKFSFLILHHCSHNWYSQKNTFVYKGNDRLIQGFAEYFHKSTAVKKACLILLEYGPDVDRSKAMINELGITENVFWLPVQTRKNLISAINLCDIGVGELGLQGWLLYSVIVEFITMGKPVIHYRNSQMYANDFTDLYPMIDTNDSAIVAQTFIDYELNPDKYLQIGKAANNWYLKNIHNVSLNSFAEKIQESRSFNKKITVIDNLFHSNKIELIKVFYWKMYNILSIKLKLKNAA